MYKFSSAQVFLLFRCEYKMCTYSCTVGKKQVPFSLAIGNEELDHARVFSQTIANA